MSIEIYRGDITTLAVDAIVNAANSSLKAGGKVGLAIHRAAGPELEAECMTHPGCPPGSAVITGAYRLPAKYVIHAVGASWHGGQWKEDEQLARTYRSSFALASQHGVRSIAFPAISCGVYSFPAPLGAAVAIRETRAAIAAGGSVERVIFALFTDAVEQAFREALASDVR